MVASTETSDWLPAAIGDQHHRSAYPTDAKSILCRLVNCRSQDLIGQGCRAGLADVGQVAAVAGHAARSILSRATWAVSRKVAMGVFP